MAFEIIEKDGCIYRRNINKTGKCKHYPDLKCCCCDPECDYNVSIDDELEDMMDMEVLEWISKQ